MYDFCPLSLYSGNREKMHAALSSLIRDPHRNMRIFVDGDVVHDELQQQICQEALCLLLFPSQNADIDTFVSVVYFLDIYRLTVLCVTNLENFT
jgi:inositol-pentakisphosphate 2-kinase